MKPSTIGTEVERQGNILIKRTPLRFEWDKVELEQLLWGYQTQLWSAGIRVPPIRSLRVAEGVLEIRMEYKGEPVPEGQHIDKMYQIVKAAVDNNLCLDPHPRNFVVDDVGRVWYVDITPPYSEEYFEAALQKSPQPDLLAKHFEVFKPKNLMAHFIADIYKTNDQAIYIHTEEQRKFDKDVDVI